MRHRIWRPVHHDNPSSFRNSVHIRVLWIPLSPIDNAQDHWKPIPCGFVIDSAITVVGMLGGQCRNSLHSITGVEAQGRCRCSNSTELFGATYARQQHKSCFCSAWTAENHDKEHCTPSPAIEKQPDGSDHHKLPSTLIQLSVKLNRGQMNGTLQNIFHPSICFWYG
jgi:hypothetical protein